MATNQQAIDNALRSLEARLERAKRIRPNSFEAWGNDKCIARTGKTIEAMMEGNASKQQIAYWIKH